MSQELNTSNNFLLYTTENGEVKVDVLLKDEAIWLTINQMAELFSIDKSGISRHIKNVFETGELQRNSVVAKIATTASDGKTYQVDFYNLDMIISVAYRVNSIRGTHFRIWATKQLTELIRKVFVLNNEKRLAQKEQERRFLMLPQRGKILIENFNKPNFSSIGAIY